MKIFSMMYKSQFQKIEPYCHHTGQRDREADASQKEVYSIELRQDFQHSRYNKEGSGSRMYSLTVRKLAFSQAGTRSRMVGQIGRHRPVFRAV